MRSYWNKLLKRDLMRDPAYYSNDKLYKREHRNDFFVPDNLIITIKTKVKDYTFGGPIYSVKVCLGKESIQIVFVPPRHRGVQQYNIKWDKILAMNFYFLPKDLKKK